MIKFLRQAFCSRALLFAVGVICLWAVGSGVYYLFYIHRKYEIPWSWPSRIAADVVNYSLEQGGCSPDRVRPLINNIDAMCWATSSVCIALDAEMSKCGEKIIIGAINNICKYDNELGGVEGLRDEIFNCGRTRNRLLLILRTGEVGQYIWLGNDGGDS